MTSAKLSFVVLLFCFAFAFGEPAIRKMIRENPSQDVYINMDVEELEQWTAEYDSPLISRYLDLITPLEEIVLIEVVLIGFEELRITPASLEPFLTHLPHRIPVHVVRSQPITSEQVDDHFRVEDDFDHSKTVNNFMEKNEHREGEKGRALIDRMVHYGASKAGRDLSKALEMLLVRHKAEQHASYQFNIPYGDIDDLIQDDYLQRSKSYGPSTTLLYVFGSQLSSAFSYHYTVDGGPESCGGTSQLGKSRWMWIDLAAGPASWGPSFSGDGTVSSTIIPYIGNYNVSNLSSSEQERRMLLTDLSAWVRRTAELLLCPSIDHFPYLLSPEREPEKTVVHLIVLHDVPFSSDEYPEHTSKYKINVLEHLVGEYQPLLGQRISFKGTDVSLFDDLNASSVYANSIRDYIYPDTVIDGETIYHTHQYLDSELIREWIHEIGVRTFTKQDSRYHVVPIFLFDFTNTDMMPLDRQHFSVSFPDMVVAIQTSPERLSYQCNGKRIRFDARDATRPMLGSIIQTLWGVLPTGDYWNESHKKIEKDWMWSVGRTPFGPFSPSTELSFVPLDAMKRPQLYQLINQTLSHTIEPIIMLHHFGFELYELLSESEYFEFVVRWNLFRYKLKEAVEMISFHEWNDSYMFIRSAHKDAKSMLELMVKARENILSYLECDHKVVTPWWHSASAFTVVLGIAIAVGLLSYLTYNKRKILIAKKRQ